MGPKINSNLGHTSLPPQGSHKSNNHLLVDGKSPNGLAASYLYFVAIVLGVNLPVSSLAGVTEFQIRSRCKDLLTSFKITIKAKPL